jgi:hypothetical protein
MKWLAETDLQIPVLIGRRAVTFILGALIARIRTLCYTRVKFAAHNRGHQKILRGTVQGCVLQTLLDG